MTRGWMSDALHKPIPPGSNDPHITPVGVVCHVAVSKAASLHNFFEHDGGIGSHFYVRYDGTIEQYRSIWIEADAQVKGNSFWRNGRLCGYVSIETEGMGHGHWTPEQVAAIKRIICFVRAQSPFPARVCRAWDDPGVGYHCQFPEWNPDAHSCPGPDRVPQFHREIKPWLDAGAEEDDMPSAREIAEAVWDHRLNEYDKSTKAKTRQAHVLLAQAHNRAGDARRLARQAENKVDKILSLLDTDKLASKIVASMGGSADYATVKQAVKDALAEGVE